VQGTHERLLSAVIQLLACAIMKHRAGQNAARMQGLLVTLCRELAAAQNPLSSDISEIQLACCKCIEALVADDPAAQVRRCPASHVAWVIVIMHAM
jgi:hypothetical protein